MTASHMSRSSCIHRCGLRMWSLTLKCIEFRLGFFSSSRLLIPSMRLCLFNLDRNCVFLAESRRSAKGRPIPPSSSAWATAVSVLRPTGRVWCRIIPTIRFLSLEDGGCILISCAPVKLIQWCSELSMQARVFLIVMHGEGASLVTVILLTTRLVQTAPNSSLDSEMWMLSICRMWLFAAVPHTKHLYFTLYFWSFRM